MELRQRRLEIYEIELEAGLDCDWVQALENRLKNAGLIPGEDYSVRDGRCPTDDEINMLDHP